MIDIVVSRTDLDLKPAPIHPDWILGGQPNARNRVLSKSHDGTAITLLWDCTAGQFNWFYDTDETIYVLDGGATLTDASGTRAIAAGDVVFFPAGSSATWQVDSYVRKVALFRHALPRPLGLAVRVWHRAKIAVLLPLAAKLARLPKALIAPLTRSAAKSAHRVEHAPASPYRALLG